MAINVQEKYAGYAHLRDHLFQPNGKKGILNGFSGRKMVKKGGGLFGPPKIMQGG